MTGRILIVDDDSRMGRSLADICNHSGYPAEYVQSGQAALDRLATEDFGCLVTDIHMPEMDGVKLCQHARHIRPGLPVILMTAYAIDAIAQTGQAVGATVILEKPIDLPQLLNLLASHLKSDSVAIIDDDPAFARSLQLILRRKGIRTGIYDSLASFQAVAADQPQILILDLKLSDAFGLDYLQYLQEAHPHLPIILVTGFRGEFEVHIKAALNEYHNAVASLYKPFSNQELIEALERARMRRADKQE